MRPEKIPVSFVVLTQDEEGNIESCLRSFAGWAGEIFIVDSGSTDRTLEIASQYTSNIVHHPFVNYSRQRNWAQDNLPLSFDWVFHVDADERVTPELAAALQKIFDDSSNPPSAAGFLVRRRIEFLGKHIRHGGIYPTYHCRIFRRMSGRCEQREYDQHFIVDGNAETIQADLIEITASSLFSWTARHNRWAQMEAKHLFESNNNVSSGVMKGNHFGSPIEKRRWWRSVVYQNLPLFFRTFIYFLLRYVIRGGFFDGRAGLIYHFLHGFWFRFYVDACLYELKSNRRSIPRAPR